jgi:hypothetical protein
MTARAVIEHRTGCGTVAQIDADQFIRKITCFAGDAHPMVGIGNQPYRQREAMPLVLTERPLRNRRRKSKSGIAFPARRGDL